MIQKQRLLLCMWGFALCLALGLAHSAPVDSSPLLGDTLSGGGVQASSLQQNASSIGNLIPAQTDIDWRLAGLPTERKNLIGDSVTTVSPSSGDMTSAIESAIRNAPTNGVVLLAPGTFRVSRIDIDRSDVVVRGSGCGTTTVEFTGSSAFDLSRSDGGGFVDLSQDAPALSNQIRVSSGSFQSGDLIHIEQDNDPATNFYHGEQRNRSYQSYYDDSVNQVLKVVSFSNGVIITETPLSFTYLKRNDARVRKLSTYKNVGIENMTLRRLNSSGSSTAANIHFQQVESSWISAVNSDKTQKYHVNFRMVYRSEVTGSSFFDGFNHGGGGNGYGVHLADGSSYNRIEDNWFEYLRHSMIVQGGANANVFGYNYSFDGYDARNSGTSPSGGTYALPSDITMHGTFSHLNLFEGNQTQTVAVDNIHGRNYGNTLFRNRIEQDIAKTRRGEPEIRAGKTPHIWIFENQHYTNVIANEIGFSGADSRTDASDQGSFRDNLQVCDRISRLNNPGPGAGDYWCDTTTINTTLLHANYDYFRGTAQYDSGLSGVSIPASAYYSAKPNFLGDAAWPVFGPEVADGSSAIPAKVRAENGSLCREFYDEYRDPSGPIVTPPPPPPPATPVPGDLFKEAEFGEIQIGSVLQKLNDPAASGG
ncbi:MAG: glycosyl hydrolase family 28-related protein, partial [Chloroflexota bacterium]